MTAEAVAKLLHGRGRGPWRAKCPVHRSTGLTLAIYADKDRVGLHCFAGCSKDDILATMGLSWKDLLYEDKKLTPAEKKEWRWNKHIKELYDIEKRIHDLNWWMEIVERMEHETT